MELLSNGSLSLLLIYMYGNEEAHACMHDADEGGGVYTSAHVTCLAIRGMKRLAHV